MNEIQTNEIPLGLAINYFTLSKSSDGELSLRGGQATTETKVGSAILLIILYFIWGNKNGYIYSTSIILLIIVLVFLIRPLLTFLVETRNRNILFHYHNLFSGTNIESYEASEVETIVITIKRRLVIQYNFRYRGKVYMKLCNGKKVVIYRANDGDKTVLQNALETVAKEFSEALGVRYSRI